MTIRLQVAPAAHALLVRHAARRERLAYADFAFSLGLGSPRALGWLLTPLLRWCEAERLPPLPILVVRRADGLPSGGYDPATIVSETARVFDHDWSAVAPPRPADLLSFAVRHLPSALRGPSELHPC